MSKLIVFVFYILSCHTALVTYGKPIRLRIICDEVLYQTCRHEVDKIDKKYENIVYVKETVKGTDDFLLNLSLFNTSLDYWNIFLAFGDATTSNAAATVASSYHIPTLLYDTSHWKDIVSSS